MNSKLQQCKHSAQGLARVAAVPALGEFQRLQKPSDIYRIPSGIEVLQGMKQIPTAPEFPVIPEAEPDSSQVDAAALASQSMLTAVSDPADEVCFPCFARFAVCNVYGNHRYYIKPAERVVLHDIVLCMCVAAQQMGTISLLKHEPKLCPSCCSVCLHTPVCCQFP